VITPGINSQVNVTGIMTSNTSTITNSGANSQINVLGTLNANASNFTLSGSPPR